MNTRTPNTLPIDIIVEILEKDERVLFAYLYGSAAAGQEGNDIDIAVYGKEPLDQYRLPADLKINLYKAAGVPPDRYDIRVLNPVIENGDIFGLLYLKNVLTESRVLVDKDPDARAVFLERYGVRFRECEGLMEEVLI